MLEMRLPFCIRVTTTVTCRSAERRSGRTTQRLLSSRCGALAGPTTRLPERPIGTRDQRGYPYRGTGPFDRPHSAGWRTQPQRPSRGRSTTGRTGHSPTPQARVKTEVSFFIAVDG
jgi:hypothetical protein